MKHNLNILGRNFQAGFSLIELMTVLVIIAILASGAFYAYGENVIKSRRTQGKNLALDLTSRMERFFVANGSYTRDALRLGYNRSFPVQVDGSYYQLNIELLPNQGYRVVATPYGPQSKDACGSFMIDHTGFQSNQSLSGGPIDDEGCW